MKATIKQNLTIAVVIFLIVGLAAGLIVSLNTWLLPAVEDPTTSDSVSDDSTSEEPTDPDGLPAGLALNKAGHQFRAIGDTVVLTATVAPANASDKRVTWSTSDSSKISIVSSLNTSTGATATIRCETVYDISVTITATTVDGGYTATCAVTYYVAVESLTIVPIVSTVANGDSFLYFNGTDYCVENYDEHPDTQFFVDVVVSPASASAVVSTSRLLTYPSWISSDFIVETTAVTWFRGAIDYDLENDTATIPLVLGADMSQASEGEMTISLDGVSANQRFVLYIAVSGVSLDITSYVF